MLATNQQLIKVPCYRILMIWRHSHLPPSKVTLLPVDCWRRHRRGRFLSLCNSAGCRDHAASPLDCSPDPGTIESLRVVACGQRWYPPLIPAPRGQRDGWLQIPNSILTQSVCLWLKHIWNVSKTTFLSYLSLAWCVPPCWLVYSDSFWDRAIVPQHST